MKWKGSLPIVWSVWLDYSGLRQLFPSIIRPKLRYGRPFKQIIPLPGSRWVRVENLQSGISDEDVTVALTGSLGVFDDALPHASKLFLGKQSVGVVTEIGSDVSLFHIGDRVALQSEARSSCASLGLSPACSACASGNPALCDHRALPWNGAGAGWSDSMIMHESQLFPVPEPLTNDQALLLEPAARAVRAVLLSGLEPGARALIIGGGLTGQLVAASIRALVPGVDITLASNYSHEKTAAAAYGVQQFIPETPNEMLAQGIELTNAQVWKRPGKQIFLGGFDRVFICRSAKKTFETGCRLVHSGGALAQIARPMNHQQKIDASLWRNEAQILHIYGPGSETLPDDISDSIGSRSSTLALAARHMMKNRLVTDGLISHKIAHTQFDQALRIASDINKFQTIHTALIFQNPAPAQP